MKTTQPFFLMLAAGLCLAACTNNPATSKQAAENTAPPVSKTAFGQLPDGRTADLYTLRNAAGMELRITNYGGTIVSWSAPDRQGQYADIVLGCDSLADYLRGTPYFGAIIGRYGNRIAKGKFSLGGKIYTLAVNNIGNSLHGGIQGFDKVLWNAEAVSGEEPALKLTCRSIDGEEGYPGNLDVEVVYTLLKNNALQIEYTARTDQETVLNLTNHSYFNLAGDGQGDILKHELKLNCNTFLPVDETLIPTGERRNVAGTVFDFTQFMPIGARINDSTDQQIRYGLGYDHCWVLSDTSAGLKAVAVLREPASGRVMEVFSTEPAIQFYSGNFLDGTVLGKTNRPYLHRNGLCLETEHFPDAPNQPAFPSTVLKPGETYRSTTVYRFSTY